MSRIMKLPPLPSVREVIALYQISAAKRLSQNFILDMKLNRKIVKMAGKLGGCHVVEVGPGPGGITRALLEQNIAHLHVVEKDERFLPSLKVLETRSRNMTTHLGDCLVFPMDNLFPENITVPWDEKMPNLHIIGNLPFNVSLPLLIQYLKGISGRTGAWRYGRTPMTLTFQDDIGARLCAEPNSPNRGRLSFDCQNLCHVTLKHVIAGSAFVPPPDVDVALVKLIPRKKPLVNLPFKVTTKLTCQLFHNRRKYIKTPLATLFPPNRQELLIELLAESEISPTRRSTNLTNEEISRLCVAYGRICDRLPYILKYEHRSKESLEHSETVRRLEKELNFVDKPSESYRSENNISQVRLLNDEEGNSFILESTGHSDLVEKEPKYANNSSKSYQGEIKVSPVRLLNDEKR